MSELPSLKRVSAVVIGASAGGVEALSAILPALRADCQASVFIVVHVPRERPSLLAEIFQAKCALPVREAQDKEPIQPGAVYFAPPDYHLLIERDFQIALSVDEEVHFSRPSIDVLFESAAPLYGDRLLGIVLSGANGDGALGLRAVQEAGGVAIVQSPSTASAPTMPAEALKAAPGSLPLDLSNIARLLSGLDGAARKENTVQARNRA